MIHLDTYFFRNEKIFISGGTLQGVRNHKNVKNYEKFVMQSTLDDKHHFRKYKHYAYDVVWAKMQEIYRLSKKVPVLTILRNNFRKYTINLNTYGNVA